MQTIAFSLSSSHTPKAVDQSAKVEVWNFDFRVLTNPTLNTTVVFPYSPTPHNTSITFPFVLGRESKKSWESIIDSVRSLFPSSVRRPAKRLIRGRGQWWWWNCNIHTMRYHDTTSIFERVLTHTVKGEFGFSDGSIRVSPVLGKLEREHACECPVLIIITVI